MKSIILSLFLMVTLADGANICVGPSATGSGTGADWNNLKAWSGTPVRGDTWYLVTGVYAAKTLSTAVSGTTVITIQKATVANHAGISTGWQDTMGTGQASISTVTFTSSYWTLDGQLGNGASVSPPDTTPGDYGILLSDSSFPLRMGNGSSGINFTTITVKHCYAKATAADTPKGFFYGQNLSSHTDNVTISYCFMDGWQVGYWCKQASTWNGLVWEYNVYINPFSSSGNHGTCIDPDSSSLTAMTMRYSYFRGPVSGGSGLTCIVEANNSNLSNSEIYGCIFDQCLTGRAIIGGTSAGQLQTTRCYNNTFLNSGSASGGLIDGVGGTGNSFFNNIAYNCPATIGTGVAHDYNYYVSTTGTPSETHSQTGSGNPFVNNAALNYALVANSTAGTNIGGAPYNVDMLGNTRSTWTRSALEFVGSPTAPSISVQPTGQNLQVGQQFNLSVTASGSQPLAYQWKQGSSALAGATLSTYTKNNAQVADSGNYTVVVTNIAGTVTSSTAAISVTNPAVALIGVSPASLAFGIQPTQTVSQLSFTVFNTGAASLSGTATVGSPFSIVSGSPYTIGIGNSSQITIGYTPTQNSWSDSNSIVLTGGGGTNVIVTGTAYSLQDPNSMSMNAATTNGGFTLTSGVLYQTATLSGPDVGAQAIVGFSLPNQITNASLLVTVEATNIADNSAWISIDSFPVDPPDIWDVTNISLVGLNLQPVGWRGTGTDTSPQFPTNQWSLGVGPHYVYISAREPMRIGLARVQSLSGYAVPPLITSQPQSVNVFSGSPVTFSVSATGSLPLAYQWNFNSIPISGANQSLYLIAYALPANTGLYSVTITNVGGTANSFAATLNVNNPPPPPPQTNGYPSNTVIVIY